MAFVSNKRKCNDISSTDNCLTDLEKLRNILSENHKKQKQERLIS